MEDSNVQSLMEAVKVVLITDPFSGVTLKTPIVVFYGVEKLRASLNDVWLSLIDSRTMYLWLC